MCGRYVSVASDPDLTDEFDAEEAVDDPPAPSWNVAPTDPVRIVVQRRHGAAGPALRQLRTVRWGLVPSWSKDRTGAAKMINARSETVVSKPAFKRAAGRRRCLVPAQGYYEWQRAAGRKIAHYLHAPDERLLAMAGLYEIWHDETKPDDDPAAWLWTCTVITRAATDALGHIHDRCPVLVPGPLRAGWLDCSGGDPATAAELLAAMPEPHLEPREVGPEVGNVKNNGPRLIEPAQEQELPVAQELF